MNCPREMGVTVSAISWQTERWASAAAMTNVCAAAISGEMRAPMTITHYKRGNERRVFDPIDESSQAWQARPNTEHTKTRSTRIMTDEITDLTTLGTLTGVAQRPASLDNDLAGTEGIGADEVRLPRLGIAQGLSHQITPGDAQFIENLTLFDMFNDLTNEIYGKGPIMFVPVRRDVRRMEFRPRSEGGGLLDPDVPPGDPRLAWRRGEGPNNEDLPPQATTFVEFVILLLRPGKAPEPIVLSIAGTNKHNRRASDQLTTFIKLRNAAIYAGLYTVDTKVPAKNDKGTFGVPTIKNAGWIPKDTPAGAALFKFAKEFHEALVGKNIVVNRDVDAEPDDSMAANPEGAAAEM